MKSILTIATILAGLAASTPAKVRTSSSFTITIGEPAPRPEVIVVEREPAPQVVYVEEHRACPPRVVYVTPHHSHRPRVVHVAAPRYYPQPLVRRSTPWERSHGFDRPRAAPRPEARSQGGRHRSRSH
ncbi:MAG: hypothetical protein H6686_00735 [Fibrobacteria bacterium]|nr:hypothetical protein [Fibrobacteria bacterium]